MKLKTFLFGVLIFLIFASGGYFLYIKYYPNLFKGDAQDISNNPQEDLIYYTLKNSLYELDPQAYAKNSNELANLRRQSTGEITSLVVDTQHHRFFYDVIAPNGASEIWKVSLKDNSSEKLFSKETSGLENLKNFRAPQLSLDNKYLGFLATYNNEDHIFSWDIEKQALSNLTLGKFTGIISCYAWDKDDNLYFVTSKDNETIIKNLKNSQISDFIKRDGSINKIAVLDENLVTSETVLNNNQKTTNLYSISLSSKLDKGLTDLVFPKTVNNLSFSSDKKKIAFEVKESLTRKTDIYIISVTGTNLLQLTNDGVSSQPVFSPDNSEIAYRNNNNTIYTETVTKQKNQKILNAENTIDKILNWR